MKQKANDILKVYSVRGVYFDEVHGYMAVCKTCSEDSSKDETKLYQIASIEEIEKD